MNIPFFKAVFNKITDPEGDGIDYLWDYFADGLVSLQVFTTKDAKISQKTARERYAIALKRFEEPMLAQGYKELSKKEVPVGDEIGADVVLMASGQKLLARTFIHEDSLFVLLAVPKLKDAESTIEKLFDSFEFVKN
jgi:hypothetical protein